MKDSSPVQNLYSKRASFYDRLFVDVLGWGQELRRYFSRASYLHPGVKVLDAGCGTGVITRVLYDLAAEQGYEDIRFHAFDLTQGMLDVFQQWVAERGASNIELRQADALDPESLPADWRDYDLVVSSTMLEYLPGDKAAAAVDHLRQRLKPGGTLLLFVTRRTWLTRLLAEKWWKTRVFDESEIHTLLRNLGFDTIASRPLSPGWSGSIMAVEATS